MAFPLYVGLWNKSCFTEHFTGDSIDSGAELQREV